MILGMQVYWGLMLRVVRHVQSANAAQFCIHKQLRQCLPADAEVILILRCGSEVVKRSVQIAVCGPQGQLVRRTAVCRHLDTFVPEAACVHVLHIYGLNHVAALAEISGHVDAEVTGESLSDGHFIAHHVLRVEVGIGRTVEVHLAERRVAVAFGGRGFQHPSFCRMQHEAALRNPLCPEAVAVRHAQSGVQHQGLRS